MNRRGWTNAAGALMGLILCSGLSSCALADVAGPPPVLGRDWNQTHQVDLLPGWKVTGRNVGVADESTSISGPDGKGCLASAWSAKPARHSWPRWPQTVEVQGFKASYGDLDADFWPYPRAVIWQDADNHWLGLSCDLDQAGILRVAEGVHAGSNPMQVPFTLDDVPEGVSMVQLIDSTWNAERTITAAYDMLDSELPFTMSISNVSDPAESVLTRGPAVRRTINGQQVEIRTQWQSICFPTESQPVCISGPRNEPASDWSPEARAVAFRTAELLSPVDDPDDEATWLGAEEALPPK